MTPAEVLSSIASQIGSISAFFGGIAATLLALLIFVKREGYLVETSIAAFVLSAVSFVVCALAATILSVGALPGADRSLANRSYIQAAMLLMNASFLFGAIGLLSGVIQLGWLRSRLTGFVTTGIGLIGLLCVLWLSVRIG